MAFGAKPVETGQSQSGERWELRNLKIIDGQEKTTASTGKVYWRVKDSDNHWYSVWEAATKVALEVAAGTGEVISCAVQIKPGKDGGAPFYTIQAAGPHAAASVEEGKKKAAESSAPGGKNSEFQKRMHPDDALRVTYLNLFGHAEKMAEFTYPDAPEKTSREQWMKAKLMEYTNFLAEIVKMPLTPTPTSTEKTSEDAPPDTYEPAPADDDIPF